MKSITVKNKNKTHKNKTHKNKPHKFRKETPPFPIDIVYTWGGEKLSNNIRIAYNEELKYSLRSINDFAPWVNKIYILMNDKTNLPSWLKPDNDKIIIVDHLETFPSKKYLPNTNSNAIETTIVNIKGLSEHYIYFNDDFFLGRNTNYTDFFTRDGKIYLNYNLLKSQSALLDNNKKSRKLNIKFPPNNGRMYEHIPIPCLKSINQQFNEEYSDYVDWIRKTKKRNKEGWTVCKRYNLRSPCQQIHYPMAKFAYSKGKVVLNNENYRTYYASTYGIHLKEKLENIEKLKPLFFCVNDTETNKSRRAALPNIMLSFFDKYFPKKPAFEK